MSGYADMQVADSGRMSCHRMVHDFSEAACAIRLSGAVLTTHAGDGGWQYQMLMDKIGCIDAVNMYYRRKFRSETSDNMDS